MVETQWDDVRGEELRYHDRTWALTGEVELQGTGERLRARARQADGVQHGTATLQFGIDSEGASLNPGDLGDVFARLERADDRYYLVVRTDPRTYRYELHSLEYE